MSPKSGCRPTLNDLALALGISRTTASNAFNRPDQLSAVLRASILAKAQELGYPGPSAAGRILSTGRAGAIGLLFHHAMSFIFHDPVGICFLQGLSDSCAQHNTGLLILPARDEQRAGEAVERAVIDGLILYAVPERTGLVDRVRQRHLHAVTVDQPKVRGMRSLRIDDRGGATLAAAHLVGLGHTQLAVLHLPERYWINLERLAGYQDALRNAGVDPATMCRHMCGDNTEEAGHAGALALLRDRPRPTAIVAMSDRLAAGAFRAAEQLRLQLPRDLSIVGFDDAPLASELSPPLTTVRQPLVEKGVAAAQMLLSSPRDHSDVLLQTELVVRGSTAPPGC